jgi:hypothetical protein
MNHITEFLIKQFLMRYLSDALTKNTTRVFPNEISHQLNARRTISNIQNSYAMHGFRFLYFND